LLLIRIITFIKGFVRVSITGKFVERFLNICMYRNIYVWDIKKLGEENLNLNLTVDGFKSIPSVASKSKTRVKIISRHGLPFIIKKHKKRKAFVIGGILFVVLLIYITSFIWVIDVVGNEKVSTERIIEALEKNGFEKGDFRYGKDIASLQNKMLLEIDELSWLWVDIKGTRAVVEVKEKVPIPEIIDKKQACNIIASKDGLITEINATYGQKAVTVGQVVKKGDLLVSGMANTKYDGIHYMHSTGVIKARTWYSEIVDFPLVKTTFSKTDKKISKNTMNFFGFRVKLYLSEDLPFEYSEEQVIKHDLALGRNLVMPISVERHIYQELERSEELLSEEEAILLATAEAYAKIDEVLGAETVVVGKTCEVIDTNEEYIKVKADYECIEEIGVTVPIETE